MNFLNMHQIHNIVLKMHQILNASGLFNKKSILYNGHYNGHIGQNSYAEYVLPELE